LQQQNQQLDLMTQRQDQQRRQFPRRKRSIGDGSEATHSIEGSAATQPPHDGEEDEEFPSGNNSLVGELQQLQNHMASPADNIDNEEANELRNLLSSRVGSPGSLGVAEPNPIVDGGTIIRSVGAINVIAPPRRSSAGAGDGAGAPDQGSDNGSEQPFLDGHFAGGWQSNADLPDRRQIIFSIIKVIERKRPDANRMSQK
jgi:hypothetical protein